MYIRSGYDVVVCGGGPAGIAASTASARNGAKTLLIEQTACLGGALTFGLPSHTFFSSAGEQVVEGIAQEFVDRLLVIGGTTGHVKKATDVSYAHTLVDPEAVKAILQDMAVEAGVDVLFHTRVYDTLVSEDTAAIEGIVVVNDNGPEVIPGKVVVDCTGNADVAFRAGAVTSKGDARGAMQAMTMTFVLGGVDLDRAIEWLGDDVILAAKPGHREPSFMRGSGTFARWADQIRERGLPFGSDDRVYAWSFRDGEVYFIAVKLVGYDPTVASQHSRAEVEARQRVWRLFQFIRDYCPGFERSYLQSTPSATGIRETRRIVGEYVLNEEDVLSGRKFPDVIARCAYPIDIHHPSSGKISLQHVGGDGSYDVPYRVLLPRGKDGLLAAGRCISVTHKALGSVRVTAVCMATGQAAGTAAALAVSSGIRPASVPIADLQRQLLADKANLGYRLSEGATSHDQQASTSPSDSNADSHAESKEKVL